MEVVHHYVEVLDKYFGNVCELDLIFNFHKVTPVPALCLARCAESPVGRKACVSFLCEPQAYYLLDEVICGGEIQESSKKAILRVMSAQDSLMEESSKAHKS